MSKELVSALVQLGAERGIDRESVLLAAEPDGEALTDDQVIGFCFLLIIAGNETTTKLIGNTLLALQRHPVERAKVVADRGRIPDAVEEALSVNTHESERNGPNRVLERGLEAFGLWVEQLVAELRSRRGHGLEPVCFVDDDPAKHGLDIHGVPVVGAPELMPQLAEKFGVSEVILALPSNSAKRIREVSALAARQGLRVLRRLGYGQPLHRNRIVEAQRAADAVNLIEDVQHRVGLSLLRLNAQGSLHLSEASCDHPRLRSRADVIDQSGQRAHAVRGQPAVDGAFHLRTIAHHHKFLIQKGDDRVLAGDWIGARRAHQCHTAIIFSRESCHGGHGCQQLRLEAATPGGAAILRIQAVLLPVQTLVLNGH